jgi:N-acetylglucosamine-6-sulfatase
VPSFRYWVFAPKLAVFLIASAVFLAGAPAQASVSDARGRPNVIVIMTDDQTVGSLQVMGNVKRLLAERGASFANSFVSFSMCCPSRATFLTGQYAHNHGVLSNDPPTGGYAKLDHSNTLPVWLQNAGYNTVHLGKYLNGYGLVDPTEIPPGWTEWHASVGWSSFRYYGYTLNERGRLVTYERAYQTDLYARKAAEIIRRRAAQTKPFFLWAAFLAPHSGRPVEPDDPEGLKTAVPAPRHHDYFVSERLPKPPGFNECDVSDKPRGIRRRPRLTPEQITAIREKYQQRLESLLAVDDAVAQIVRALRASGELRKTLIVFISDNGFLHGEHRDRSGKVLPYEPSIRVPLIVRGPGVPAGLRLTQPVANIDLAPTIVEAAGATAGRDMDGNSLLPLFQNSAIRFERDLLLEGPPGTKNFAGIRTARYVYAEYWNGEHELYDLAHDPYELKSRHADPAYDVVEQDLAVRLAWLRTCAGETCRMRLGGIPLTSTFSLF